MKKLLLFMFILVNITCLTGLNAAPGNPVLKTSTATLSIDQKSNLKIVHNNGQIIQVNTPVNKLWKIILKNRNNNREFILMPEKVTAVTMTGNTINLKPGNIKIENNPLALEIQFSISVRDDAFSFSGSIKNSSDEWMVKDLDYPVLSGITFNDAGTSIYWPVGLGQCFTDPSSFGSRNIRYPSGMGAAMGWFAVNSQKAGLYVGSHDVQQETKVFNLEYDKVAKTFQAFINTTVCRDEYTIPEMIIKTYDGEWYQAAKFYRTWYDRNFKVASQPDWVKDDAGWLLAILKQQNMEVMWPYKKIDQLCDVAERFNLTTIGLFGWTLGGHDHLYPNYTPCNLMGGIDELKSAIERAHKRGIKIIIYANGKIMDTSTDYYDYNGYETMLVMENKQPQIQYYIKQKKATPVIFAQGCTGSHVWRKTMYDLGLQAASLGADGILYDQVGIMGVNLCYSDHHDHFVGGGDEANRLQMMNEARKVAREINPDFIIMTEGTNDKIIEGIEYHHGCGVGFQPSSDAFPSLFRYTFPELLTTQRNPNPMITRTDANFSAVYGLRHEIETRYAGDVDYLLNGTLPTPAAYSNVVSIPDLKKMNLQPAKEAEKYVHTLIEFENQNSDFFRRGKFIGSEGIDFSGEDILVTGFQNGNKLGVVVWNKSETEKRQCSVMVSDYQLKGASEPGVAQVDPKAPVDKNTIRLLVYEKKLIKENKLD
jgi:hypothetical protein